MEVENTRRGGLSSPPHLPFGFFVRKSIACPNTNSSCVCLVNLKLMTTDIHDHNNYRISFLSRLVSVVSQISFNIILPGLRRLECQACQYCFTFIIRVEGRKERLCIAYECMYAYNVLIQSKKNKPADSVMLNAAGDVFRFNKVLPGEQARL